MAPFPSPDYLSPVAAAQKLGLSERRVRLLAESGRLRAEKVGNRWLIDANALLAFLAAPRSGGRPLEPETAWSLLLEASGEPQPRWAADARVKLPRRLRAHADASLVDLLPQLRRRSEVHHLLGTTAAQDEVRRHPKFVASGVSAAVEVGANVAAPGVLDGYLPEKDIARIGHLFALEPVPELRANLILRAPAVRQWPLGSRRVAPKAVVAADLAESASERTRAAGKALLRELQ